MTITLPLASIHRTRTFPAMHALNRFLLLHNLGHVDVLAGRYVAALYRDNG